MKIVMTRTIGASEDIGIHASSANTKRAHPSSRLLSLCSRRQTYGPGWSPLADPPPRPCDEASSACIAECSPGEEAVKQSILQDHHLDTSADEKRRENTQKDSQQTKTVDAGWAWVVLPAAFYIILFMVNTADFFGILFSQKMFELSASSTNVSIIFTTHLIMRQCGILITNSLVSQFGYRKVAFWSCFLGSASVMILAFTSSLTYVFINYSIVHGMSAGIGITTSVMIIAQYFERRRGFALAVIMTGSAVGGMVFPMLVRSLQDEFGFVGGVLLLGAIISNCCVAASVFRPPPLESKPKSYGESRSFINTHTNIWDKKCITSLNMKQLLVSVCKRLSKWFTRAYAVSRQRRVLLFGLSIGTMEVGFYNFMMLIPFSVEFSGKSPAISAWYITTCSLANIGTKIIMAGLADRTWMKKGSVTASGALLASLSVVAFVVVSEKLLTATMLCFGVGIGLYWSLYHAHMIDVLGLELFKEAYGINSVCLVAVLVTTGPAIGIIRDWSGSYSWSITPCAGLMLVSAILLLLLSLAEARDKKMQEQN